jgi:hypothetical protein
MLKFKKQVHGTEVGLKPTALAISIAVAISGTAYAETGQEVSCKVHATYSGEDGTLYIPFVDMPTVPMIGGNHTPSEKTVTVEATLQLIEASDLFEIEDIKLPSTVSASKQCHATYSLDGQLHIPFVDVPLLTILNGIPIPLGVDT